VSRKIYTHQRPLEFPVFLTDTNSDARWLKIFIYFSAFILIVRLLTIAFSSLNLSVDEAQYWRWSTIFDWGYYSKPPMIAWVIGASTFIFGDAEWAIRLFAPFLHATSGLVLFLLGRKLADAKTGCVAGLIYLLMPGVTLSSSIISTDAILLTFWSSSLYLLFKLREAPRVWVAAALGATIGVGFLSKYAMVYFLIGIALSLILDRELRKALFSSKGAITLGAALIVLTPHILWSVSNGFKTIGHTADNANWGQDQDLFNLDQMLTFFFDQFGVFGPTGFLLLIMLIGTLAFMKGRLRGDIRGWMLLSFILPPLLIILVQAFISRAHANWAATAYPAAAVLVALWVTQSSGRWIRYILWGGLAFNFVLAMAFSYFVTAPPSVANAAGFSNAFKRVRAWPETVDVIMQAARDMNATSIIVDEREIWHGLDYYGRDGSVDLPLRSWQIAGVPQSFSEETPISPAEAENALVLNVRPRHLPLLSGDFEVFEPAGEIEIDLGRGRTRHFRVFHASGFNPQPRTSAEE
tara:strand:+ start:56801 stop:58369 length:1569 start_codon:yes stop_codon:yes gene_type:complete